MNKSITIKEKSQGQRLDVFLTETLTELSRSQIQKLIKSGNVLVNGSTSSVHNFLKAGDKIQITSLTNEAKQDTTKTTKNPKENNRKLFPAVKIIDEQEGFLIIEKPSGLLVHPTDKNETDTLVDCLVEKYPALKKVGEDPARAAIVHRLDKEVSGLMIIPKTQDAFEYFKSKFKLHEITKKYLALVYGETSKDGDEIDFPIARSKNKPGLFAAKPHSQIDDESKKALTIFKVLKRFKNYTLLEIQILTGRTHQIRTHLLAYGHPIIGDKLYKNNRLKDKIKAPRIFLHAAELEFIDNCGEKRHYISKLPGILEDIIKKRE